MQQSISVSVFDSSGNTYTGNVTIAVNLVNVATNAAAPVTLVSSSNGVYQFQFTLFAAGAWTSSVLINGAAVVTGVPASVTVLSGPAVAAVSQIVYPGSVISYVAGTPPGLVTILQARDQVFLLLLF